MTADTQQHFGSFQRTWWRVAAGVWVAGLVAVLVGSLAAAPASAQAPPPDGTVFVHSAKSGNLAGGRLTLQGVGRRVTWAHHSGRSGVIAVKHMHRRVFSETSAATGTLHVAGHRGGDELTFKLSDPRHNHARRTVSFKARPLGNGRFPSRAAAQAAAAARQFGAASLSIQDSPQPSLTVTQDTYGCTSGAAGTCWGILYGSNLQPWGVVNAFAPQVPGNSGQGKNWDITVPANGLAGGNGVVYLNFLCNNPAHIVHTRVDVDGSQAGGPSFTVQAPGSCS
jgi:hypothetical protein